MGSVGDHHVVDFGDGSSVDMEPWAVVFGEVVGPVAIAQDPTVINVTPEQIVVGEAQTDLLHDTPPGPDEGPPEFDPKNPGVTPSFVTDTILPVE